MACKLTSIEGKPIVTQKEYLLTNLADIEKLPRYGIRGTFNDPNDTVKDNPCNFGSTALLCTGGMTEVYILTSDNEWVLM